VGAAASSSRMRSRLRGQQTLQWALLVASTCASSEPYYFYSPSPPPTPVESISTARGEPVFVGVVCAFFWAIVWALLYRVAVPRLRLLPLRASWGLTALPRQKALLTDLGFNRSSIAQSPTDEQAADIFAWLCITGVVYLAAGAMALPTAWYGYDRVSASGHLLFFTSTWLILGWCLFDAVDETQRCWAGARYPTSLSGVRCPCPRNFWAAMCLMHHPFWLALVLPMNALLADLPAYHALVGSLALGSGVQLILRQTALVLGASGRRMQVAYKLVSALHAAWVVMCRGALFFPLTIDVAVHLHDAPGGNTASQIYMGPAVLMGIINIAMILDAIKDSMFCAAPAAPASQADRPLRAASADDLTSPSPGRPEAPSQPRTHGKADRPRKGKKQKGEKGQRQRDAKATKGSRAGLDLDEEMTFGFASAEVGDNSLEEENEDYNDDADDDASMVGEGPPATFRARRRDKDPPADCSRDLPSSTRPPPRFEDASSVPCGRNGPSGCGSARAADGPAAASARARARTDDIEGKKARLRREMEDAQQQRECRRAAREAPDASAPPKASAPAAAPPTETVDHAAIFASGVLPAKKSHYSMLGVPRSAGPDEVRKAYNRLAMKWHPDKNPSDTVKAELVFMAIKDAYETLSDPVRRRRYDRS